MPLRTQIYATCQERHRARLRKKFTAEEYMRINEISKNFPGKFCTFPGFTEKGKARDSECDHFTKHVTNCVM